MAFNCLEKELLRNNIFYPNSMLAIKHTIISTQSMVKTEFNIITRFGTLILEMCILVWDVPRWKLGLLIGPMEGVKYLLNRVIHSS